ncbi:MAG: CoA-binding protein [Candidatus Bilamarchaeaceae archaeon]
MNEINKIFEPKAIAVIGATQKTDKVGYVILRNLIDGRYAGQLYPVNPKYDEILGLKCYKTVLDIKKRVDCALIAVPAPAVPLVVKECGLKGVKGVVILSGGFEEVGRKDLADEIKKYAKEYNLAVIGPNCLGIYNPYNHVDSIFFPMYKLGRPRAGDISFITQSGAVGSVMLDLAAKYNIGVSKFISYGNGTVIDECDLLEFLGKDKKTKTIILYIEGIKKGRKFLKMINKVNKKKPIVVLKAGKGEQGKKAAVSHTGNLAGNYLAYKAAFRQAKVVEAQDVDELFNLMRIFSQPLATGKRVGVITNGGGLGVLTTDAIEKEGLELAEFDEKMIEELKKAIPPYVNARNPLDMAADATVESYEKTINLYLNNDKIDMVVVSVLFQTPTLDERLINVIGKAVEQRKKPIIVVTIGGEYTEVYRKIMESKEITTFTSPAAAIKTLRKFVEYSFYIRCKINKLCSFY